VINFKTNNNSLSSSRAMPATDAHLNQPKTTRAELPREMPGIINPPFKQQNSIAKPER
jgi:hypothetical protein